MNNKLFVGNLSFDTTELALQDLFAAHGVVEDVNLVTDRVTGRPRGFAFVTMSKPEEAQTAISELNGKNVNGRDITVTEARPREERSGGGGGGGRGYGGGGGGGRGYGGGGGRGGERERGPRRERY
jgi:RNA recognition motif-containing protein